MGRRGRFCGAVLIEPKWSGIRRTPLSVDRAAPHHLYAERRPPRNLRGSIAMSTPKKPLMRVSRLIPIVGYQAFLEWLVSGCYFEDSDARNWPIVPIRRQSTGVSVSAVNPDPQRPVTNDCFQASQRRRIRTFAASMTLKIVLVDGLAEIPPTCRSRGSNPPDPDRAGGP